LEFRRLLPLLSPHYRAIAVDLLGFGFSERHPQFPPTPVNIKCHLDHFWQTVIQKPMVLVGVSMGGAAALDFCLSFPDRVEKLILIDSAGLASQPFASRLMFPPVDRWLTRFLASPKVRQNISKTAYYDQRFASADARICAGLHLQCPGWSDGLIAFTKSGGYGSFRAQLPQLTLPSLVIWGKQDKILGTKAAGQFAQLLPNNQLVWIDHCGHVPHLEQAEQTATAIHQFLR
jgi:pimeloyl-ACP methyl ester carboxylesterase